jgi:hypothetical protein
MRTATIHPIVPEVTELPLGVDMTTYAIAAIADWNGCRSYYHLTEISYRLKLPVSRHLTFALKVNCWSKVRIRITEHNAEGLKRPVRTVWQPPNNKIVYKPPQGRPSYIQLLYESNLDQLTNILPK